VFRRTVPRTLQEQVCVCARASCQQTKIFRTVDMLLFSIFSKTNVWTAPVFPTAIILVLLPSNKSGRRPMTWCSYRVSLKSAKYREYSYIVLTMSRNVPAAVPCELKPQAPKGPCSMEWVMSHLTSRWPLSCGPRSDPHSDTSRNIVQHIEVNTGPKVKVPLPSISNRCKLIGLPLGIISTWFVGNEMNFNECELSAGFLPISTALI
jgi:hypothetical protein